MGKNIVQEIMYRVLHIKAMYIMGIDFFRFSISINKCLENYVMHTKQINGGKIAQRTLSSMADQSSVILSFFKDLNFIMIDYKFTIHDAPHFAFLYLE